MRKSKLETNLINVNGTYLKVKHIVFPILAVPFIWAFLIIAFNF